jgi:hypothetical protein
LIRKDIEKEIFFEKRIAGSKSSCIFVAEK